MKTLTIGSVEFCFTRTSRVIAGATAIALAQLEKDTGMTQLVRKAVLGLALAATATIAAAPVQAQSYDRYDRYDRHRGGDAGAAIAAGIVGLAIGAALSSGNHGRYYTDRDYAYSYNYPQYRGGYYNNYPQYNGYQLYNGYPQYNGYYYNYQDRRYRDEDRYEREHQRWHERHDRRGY